MVDLETLAALYENVSVKRIQNGVFVFLSTLNITEPLVFFGSQDLNPTEEIQTQRCRFARGGSSS